MNVHRVLVGVTSLLLFVLDQSTAEPVLQGYDVVEYFKLEKEREEGKPLLGKLGTPLWACRLLTYDFSKAKKKRPVGLYEFWFSSPRNVRRFNADPWKYAPKYGGFGAWGIGLSTSGIWNKNTLGPPVHPWDGWRVYNGSLYVLQWRAELFIKNASDVIALADDRWTGWYGALNAGPFNTGCQNNLCFSVPHTRQDLSGLSNDVPEVQCTTNGFTHQISDIVQKIGASQLELFQLQKSSPSRAGGSSEGGLGPLISQDVEEDPGVGTILGTSPEPDGLPKKGSLAVTNPETIGNRTDALKKPFNRRSFVDPALMGYDMVAYFDIKGAEEGRVGTPKYACHVAAFDKKEKNKSLLGVYEFWFENETNMEKFREDPWKYVPQFGGFCSWGIATELKKTGWPWDKDFLGPPAQPWDGWTVYEGKLYFNYWPSIAGSFFAAPERNIAEGSKRWKRWYGSLQAGPINTHCPNAVCIQDKQNLSPPCPRDAKCDGDVPEVACLVRNTVSS